MTERKPMSASQELVLEVAREMREAHGPEHPRHAMWSAFADWLEAEAELRPTELRQVWDPAWSHAIRIAKAYREVDQKDPQQTS